MLQNIIVANSLRRTGNRKMNKKIKLSAPVLIWMVQISQHWIITLPCLDQMLIINSEMDNQRKTNYKHFSKWYLNWRPYSHHSIDPTLDQFTQLTNPKRRNC